MCFSLGGAWGLYICIFKLLMLYQIILFLTLCISVVAFSSARFKHMLIGHPYSIYVNGEWYRILTSGFIHLDVMHLFFNLYSLFSFASMLDSCLERQGGRLFAEMIFFLVYIGGILTANLVSYYMYKTDYNYFHLGASAGVAAVMAGAILCAPHQIGVRFLFFPGMGIPGIIFLPLYLLYSFMASGRHSRIGHMAHFVGGIYGLVIMLIVRWREIFMK